MEDHTGIRRTRSATSELVYRIRARIREQELLPGEKLGSERALADSLGVSRSDLRNALTVLESDHEIIRKIGRVGGIVISDGRLERNINTVESLPTIARRQGMRVSSKVLQAVIAPGFRFRRAFAAIAGRASDDLRHYAIAVYRKSAAFVGTVAFAGISVSSVPYTRFDDPVLHHVRT